MTEDHHSHLAHQSRRNLVRTPVSSRVRASWERSLSYGVSPEHVDPVFTGDLDTGSLFYECGSTVLAGLHAALANEPVSLMIADSDGLVLTRLCNDHTITASLNRVHLAPGFYFTERNAGTNGLGLALADRAPTLVRAHEHYCSDLQGYTCAAVPVIDHRTGDLAGTVNLTTWAESSAEMLLALAQSAASNTSALMLLRSTGHKPRPTSQGRIVRVFNAPSVSTRGTGWSTLWTDVIEQATTAVSAGRVVAAVGEQGSGKSTLLTTAHQHSSTGTRLLSVRPPDQESFRQWLELWTPELRQADTRVLIAGVDTLPAWIASSLAEELLATRTAPSDGVRFMFTALDFAQIPAQLKELIDTVVEAPPLRRRPEDIMLLAAQFAREERHREITFTPRATKALTTFEWSNNIRQLQSVIRNAVSRTDIVDARHLPPEIFSGSTRPLNRIDSLKRDEIIRCLNESGTTVAQAAAKLGMSRATIYRKIDQYNIQVPRRP